MCRSAKKNMSNLHLSAATEGSFTCGRRQSDGKGRVAALSVQNQGELNF